MRSPARPRSRPATSYRPATRANTAIGPTRPSRPASSSYASDEHNPASYTALLMLVGGARMPGIHHAHFAGGYEIRYAASDAKLETIPWVEWEVRVIPEEPT